MEGAARGRRSTGDLRRHGLHGGQVRVQGRVGARLAGATRTTARGSIGEGGGVASGVVGLLVLLFLNGGGGGGGGPAQRLLRCWVRPRGVAPPVLARARPPAVCAAVGRCHQQSCALNQPAMVMWGCVAAGRRGELQGLELHCSAVRSEHPGKTQSSR